jgi:hypothetical protein
MTEVTEDYYDCCDIISWKNLDPEKQKLTFLTNFTDENLGLHKVFLVKQNDQFINLKLSKDDISYIYVKDEDVFFHIKNKNIMSSLTTMDLFYQDLNINKEYYPILRKYERFNNYYIKARLLLDFPDKNVKTVVEEANFKQYYLKNLMEINNLKKKKFEIVLMINKMYEMIEENNIGKLRYAFTVRIKKIKIL